MKGCSDGGIYVPHSETRFYGYDPESKEYNAEAHRDRIFGKHVADYMTSLKDSDEDSYNRQFARFIKEGINAGNLTDLYKKAHDAIRSNPEHAVKSEKKVVKKRWTAKKITLQERKARISNKKAYLTYLKNLQDQ